MKSTHAFLKLLLGAACLPIAALSLTFCSGNFKDGPCDIYAKGGTPCVTAHSTTRLLYSKYNGPLYQVVRESDGQTLDIGTIKGGYADAAAQDNFLKGTIGYIYKIYDQSGNGNDLVQAAPGTFLGPAKGKFNTMAIADMAPATINGHRVYGTYIMPGMGYRNNDAKNIAIDDEPEGMYYVIDGRHFSSGCCFDYGNGSTNGRAVGTGTMETTYYGTATAWGSGNGDGPWIMSDMEAGLFSGYNAKKNDVPSITDWNFISVFMNGGGGNQWDLRGAEATNPELTTFYSGVRPGTKEGSDSYYPMHKKGAVLLGNGGDNGNGSAGTFFEGVMTSGYPTDEAINAVQANVAAAKYADPYFEMSRLVSFTPGSSQKATLVFANSSSKTIKSSELVVEVPQGWVVDVAKDEEGDIAPGAKRLYDCTITAPAGADAGFIALSAVWDNGDAYATQRIRCVEPIKINEVGISGLGKNLDQFVELYNASDSPVDISGWNMVVTHSGWTSVNTAVIPDGTTIPAGGFYTLSKSEFALVADAAKGEKVVYLKGENLKAGDVITIDGEKAKVAEAGSVAGEPTVIFTPISTGPWMDIPAGVKNIPVESVAGFAAGQKMSIDLGGKFEIVTITEVGTASTQVTTADVVKAGDTSFDLAPIGGVRQGQPIPIVTANLLPGFEITVGTGQNKEVVKIKSIQDNTITIETPLQYTQIALVDVSCPGSGISFSEPLQYAHKSGDAVQSLGSGVTLAEGLASAHSMLSPVWEQAVGDQMFGYGLSKTAGTVALYDRSGKVLMDAIVYGSQQSSSSANGTIASPAIATLEGNQAQGGSIAVVPQPRRMPRGPFGPMGRMPNFKPQPDPIASLVRIPDGNDTDNLSSDFKQATEATPGSANK